MQLRRKVGHEHLLHRLYSAQTFSKSEGPTGERPWRPILIAWPKAHLQPRNPPPRTCSARYALILAVLPFIAYMPRCQVNNAYEVLCDPQSRTAYDQHGVWPPPEPAPQGPFASGPHNSFSDPFFRDAFSQNPFFRGPRMDPFGGFGFGSRSGPRGFTDPFVLFDSIFGDFHRAFEGEPFFDDTAGRRGFGSNHFGGGFFNNGFPSVPPSPFDFSGRGMQGSTMQSFSNGGSGGRWVSESWTSSNINGVTHTKCVRRDSEVGIQVLPLGFPVILTTT